MLAKLKLLLLLLLLLLLFVAEAVGPKVLLVSRAAAYAVGGMSIPSANVVVFCGPWASREWEMQAIARVYCSGQQQTGEVTVVTLVARDCEVEAYTMGERERRHKDSDKIMKHITRKDGDEPTIFGNLH